jgi:hypothetical protein
MQREMTMRGEVLKEEEDVIEEDLLVLTVDKGEVPTMVAVPVLEEREVALIMGGAQVQ